MWRRRAAIGLVVGAVLLVGAPSPADDAPLPGAPVPAAPTDAVCEAACGPLIARCVAVFGPAMGDMRPFCRRAVLRRCRAMGLAVCERAGEAVAPSEPKASRAPGE